MTVGGNLTVSAGTLDLATFTANGTGFLTTLTVSNGATLKIGGTNTMPAGYMFHSFGGTSTVEYSGSNQTVSNENYGNLTLSGSGTKTLAAGLTINGNLTLSGTATATTPSALTIGDNLNVGAGTTFATGATNKPGH